MGPLLPSSPAMAIADEGHTGQEGGDLPPRCRTLCRSHLPTALTSWGPRRPFSLPLHDQEVGLVCHWLGQLRGSGFSADPNTVGVAECCPEPKVVRWQQP